MNMPAIDRRTALQLLGTSLVLPWRGEAVQMTPAIKVVDHLLLGIGDLDRGIAWVAERTGVRAVIGGSHPGRGTRNALVSLGPMQYLEIIAPDPAQTAFTFQIDVRSLEEPRLINWAAGTTDIDDVARRAKAAGRQVLGPTDGSRARPDGKLMKWRSLGIASELAAGAVQPIPFFIQWSAGTVHPSEDSPKGCTLRAFRILHPSAAAVRDLLTSVGIDADVGQEPEATIRATLNTPNGTVELR